MFPPAQWPRGETYPAGTEGVNVGTADARVGDLDVNIRLLPSLRLILLPDHVALGGRGVLANPSLELVVGAHVCCLWWSYEQSLRVGGQNKTRICVNNKVIELVLNGYQREMVYWFSS